MSIEKIINDAWENKDQVNQNSEKSLFWLSRPYYSGFLSEI